MNGLDGLKNATKQKNEEGIVSKKFNMLKSKKKRGISDNKYIFVNQQNVQVY